MNRKRVVAVAACMAGLFIVSASFAQAPAPPKPGAEVQKLGYFVGEWKYEGENRQSAFGPAAKYAGTETCEWFSGSFQVVCRNTATGPAGKITGLSVIAYDPETKEYTYYAIDSSGFNALARGTLNGDAWVFDWTGTVGGKPAKIRATMRMSPTFYTGTTEASLGGGPMAVIGDVKSTRVK